MEVSLIEASIKLWFWKPELNIPRQILTVLHAELEQKSVEHGILFHQHTLPRFGLVNHRNNNQKCSD